MIVVRWYGSVEHPAEAHVAREISAIIPVRPDLAPSTDVGLPESVLNNAQMVAATLSEARVEREADTVGLWAEIEPQVALLQRHLLFQVPHVDLVGRRVDSRDTRCSRSDGGLLVGILAVLKLDDLAHENALRISRVGTYSHIPVS